MIVCVVRATQLHALLSSHIRYMPLNTPPRHVAMGESTLGIVLIRYIHACYVQCSIVVSQQTNFFFVALFFFIIYISR